MHILYPPIKPYQEHQLAVQPPHKLYIEECGNPDGLPVIFLHGGPGAGCEANHRRFFDPEKYRIVLFDQRGCGHSTPHGSLDNNHTQALIEDMEAIRKHLGIEQWVLFGGSWGSTLALTYAQQHPDAVRGLILRGVFLCRDQDLTWIYENGANRIFPDAWEEFIRPIHDSANHNLFDAYLQKLTGRDELARMAAAKAWSNWEAHCATLRPNQSVMDHFADPHTALSLARIEAHYFKHKGFLEPNQILDNVDKIKHLPCVMVHGRYDMICPLDNAYALHQAWPGSELIIIREAGHASSETGIIDALVKATDELAKKLEQSA